MSTPMQCKVVGLGAWGPGFNSVDELRQCVEAPLDSDIGASMAPKPAVIPANERRRAPLPVKAAVEVSWQAINQSGLQAQEVACVFGSGLGDTQITDYMCRALTQPEKLLSPTRFHNSVHNAAAGYWTISTGCMKSANSVAGYRETVGLSLLEAVTQCLFDDEPVLVTVFDIAAHDAYASLFPVHHSLAASVLLCPPDYASEQVLGSLSLTMTQRTEPRAQAPGFVERLSENPSAELLYVVAAAAQASAASLNLALSASQDLQLRYEPADA